LALVNLIVMVYISHMTMKFSIVNNYCHCQGQFQRSK